MRDNKVLKVLEKFASENNLQTESTTEQLKQYPSNFKPNYTVKLMKGNQLLLIISFNRQQYYIDEVTDEGKPFLTQLEKQLRQINVLRVK